MDSEVLDNIHKQFRDIVFQNGIQIHSFQEARGISGMQGLDEKVCFYNFLNMLSVILLTAFGEYR